MKVTNVIITLFLIAIISKQLKYIKELIIPTRKGSLEIIAIIIFIFVLIIIMYFYAKTTLHYIVGFLGILTLISMWMKQGISSRGFLSMSRGQELIKWSEINKVTVLTSNHIKVTLSGGFMQQSFHFRKKDYDKLSMILKENLMAKSELKIIDRI